MFDDNHLLTPEEILEYKNQGYDMDEKKVYMIRFLFNDQWNEAADPRPFRIKTELIEKLAKDAIGMPYVVDPDNINIHLRPTKEGLPDTPEEMLKMQAKYAYGIIRAPIIKPNNNVYGIIEIFKDYEEDALNGKLPPFTSPMIVPLVEDEDGISDGQFININAVGVSGYPPSLAGIVGVCKNGIKECMAELAMLGASGHLKSARDNTKTFLNNLSSLNKNMSSTEGTTGQPESKAEPSLSEIKTAIEGVQKTTEDTKVIAEKVVANVENNNVVLKEVATVTEGVDETKVKEKIDESSAPADGTPENPPMVGASGKDGVLTIPKEFRDQPWAQKLLADIKDTKKSLEELKKETMSRKEAEALAARTAQATSIVERLVLLNQVDPAKKEAEIKKYVDMKNEDGSFKDIEALDNFLKSTVQPEANEPGEMVGASGYLPGSTGDRAPQKLTNAQILGVEE